MTMTTDGDLRDAIEKGATLAANLSDASVHYIENRREELSQLQWKLMRDQVSGVAEKLVQVGHRVQELTEGMASMKHEHEESCRRMRYETEVLIENAKETGKHDLHTLGERVDAVNNSISSERNRREVAKQNTEQQLQGIRDMLSADRSTRRSELVATNSMLEERWQALLEESRCREAIETRHTSDVNWLSERIESLARSQAEKVQDLCDQVKTVALNVSSSLQDGTRSVLQVQSIAESTQIEVTARIRKLDDRMANYEKKISEIANREVLHYDELQAKTRKLISGLEEFRLEERGRSMGLRQSQAVDEAEELRKGSPLSNTFFTQVSEAEGSSLPPQVQGGPSGSLSMQQPSSQPSVLVEDLGALGNVRNSEMSRSYHRGAAARSVSPPLPLQQFQAHPLTPQQFPQGYTPVAIPSTPGSSQGRSVGAPPQALRPGPRSVSPIFSRSASYNSQQAMVQQPMVSGANLMQPSRQVSVPRQRPEGNPTAPVR